MTISPYTVPPSAPVANNDAGAGAGSWFVFFIYLGVLGAADIAFLQTPLGAGRMSFRTAIKLTAFWFATGMLFDLFILGHLGWAEFVGFLQGTFLEYTLSFDNLFVFHLVFAYYCTPDHLLYRALYFGIAGAIVLRILLFLVGTGLFNSGFYIVKFFFGSVLVWSGIRQANDDEQDVVDPTNNPFIQWVTQNLPVSDSYEPNGQFFVTVAEVECRPLFNRSGIDGDDDEHQRGGDSLSPQMENERPSSAFPRLESFEGSSLLPPAQISSRDGVGGDSGSSAMPLAAHGSSFADGGSSVGDSFAVTRQPAKLKRKASLLLLVVVAVWFVDMVFAVDSVASKLASVDDLFLNCTSSAFAMMSLRSMYFVMESLVQTFHMLKYGIAALLVLIGLKLIFAQYITVGCVASFIISMFVVAAAIASSYWWPAFCEGPTRGSLGGLGDGRLSDLVEDPDAEMEAAEEAGYGAGAGYFAGGYGGGAAGSGAGASSSSSAARADTGTAVLPTRGGAMANVADEEVE